jgi:predicted RNase H-like HicB family nuclease
MSENQEKVRGAIKRTLEFLEHEFGNVVGNDWANEEAGHVADDLESALSALSALAPTEPTLTVAEAVRRVRAVPNAPDTKVGTRQAWKTEAIVAALEGREAPAYVPTVEGAGVERIRLNVEFEREDDGRWIADMTVLPGVMAYGATKDEALANALLLASNVVRDAKKYATPPPQPEPRPTAFVVEAQPEYQPGGTPQSPAEPAAPSEAAALLRGTYSCPRCGRDTPHAHVEERAMVAAEEISAGAHDDDLKSQYVAPPQPPDPLAAANAELAKVREALDTLNPYTPRCADESPSEWARRLLAGLRQRDRNFHEGLAEIAALRKRLEEARAGARELLEARDDEKARAENEACLLRQAQNEIAMLHKQVNEQIPAERARADAAEKEAKMWRKAAEERAADQVAAEKRAEEVERVSKLRLDRALRRENELADAERRIGEAVAILRGNGSEQTRIDAALAMLLTPPSVSGGAEGEGVK